MPEWVFFCDITRKGFLSLFLEYVEIIFSYSVSDPIKYHEYCSEYVCFPVPLTMLFAAVLSVVKGVGGCGWPISDREILMDVAFWQFSNNPPNSASVADVMIFLIMLGCTCTGTFYRYIYCIGVLDVGPRKNIRLLCFVPPILICRMNPNICGE